MRRSGIPLSGALGDNGPVLDGWLDKIFDGATFKKMMIVLAFAPIWFPIAKAFWKEIQGALAPDGGFMGKEAAKDVEARPPALDPWLSVPRHARRRARSRGSSSSAPPRPAAPRSSQSGQRGPRRRTF